MLALLAYFISQKHLMTAAQRGAWCRAPGESDLQIILEHEQSIVLSEAVLLALLKRSPPGYHPLVRRLYRFALGRSDCGVTSAIVRTVSDRQTWQILYDYHQHHQLVHKSTTKVSRDSRTTYDHIEEESQSALKRIETLTTMRKPRTLAHVEKPEGGETHKI